MPVIVKENKLVENLDDSSKKCLKSLIEALSLDLPLIVDDAV